MAHDTITKDWSNEPAGDDIEDALDTAWRIAWKGVRRKGQRIRSRRYSRDLGAAFYALGEYCADFPQDTISISLTRGVQDDGWRCEIQMDGYVRPAIPGLNIPEREFEAFEVWGDAETLPLAISRALIQQQED